MVVICNKRDDTVFKKNIQLCNYCLLTAHQVIAPSSLNQHLPYPQVKELCINSTKMKTHSSKCSGSFLAIVIEPRSNACTALGRGTMWATAQKLICFPRPLLPLSTKKSHHPNHTYLKNHKFLAETVLNFNTTAIVMYSNLLAKYDSADPTCYNLSITVFFTSNPLYH